MRRSSINKSRVSNFATATTESIPYASREARRVTDIGLYDLAIPYRPHGSRSSDKMSSTRAASTDELVFMRPLPHES